MEKEGLIEYPQFLNIFSYNSPTMETFLKFLVGAIVIYTLFHAAVIVYHWYRYNITSKKFILGTYIVYFSGIFVFLILILGAAATLIS